MLKTIKIQFIFFYRITKVSQQEKGKVSILDFNKARDDDVALASARPYKPFSPHSRQVTMPTPHHSLFTGRCIPTSCQQCQSTECNSDRA